MHVDPERLERVGCDEYNHLYSDICIASVLPTVAWAKELFPEGAQGLFTPSCSETELFQCWDTRAWFLIWMSSLCHSTLRD